MSYPIEDNVPVPSNARSARNKYPLDQLQPGQSFYVPMDKARPNSSKNLRSSMSVRAKKLNFKIVTVADDSGVRVWRTQ